MNKILLSTVIATSLAGLAFTPSASAKKDYFAKLDGQQLFEQVCSSCHNLELPKSQKLDRATWAWVIDDMVGYGLMGVPQQHLDRLADYLAEAYGPGK